MAHLDLALGSLTAKRHSAKPPENLMNIEVGEKLFEFRSKQDWINRAQRIWKLHEVRSQNTVCIDQKGRICGWGEHFATAERDNAYPIEVFRLRADMTPNAAGGRAAIKGQGKDRIEDVTFKCPKCGTLQSAQDLIDAGAGANLDEVEKYLGFSCVGRWSDEKGCDWTLGGLFQIHTLEVVTPNGEHHPRFEPATA